MFIYSSMSTDIDKAYIKLFIYFIYIYIILYIYYIKLYSINYIYILY